MLNKKLLLEKTYDYSAVKEPKLTVVFIHGIASDSSTFTKAIQYLEGVKSLQGVRYVTFDLLGSGKSLCSDELNYSFEEQLEALGNSIEKLNIGDTPLVLVGHSMGALIVSRYADAHRRQVRELVLISPPIYTEKDLDNPAFVAGMKLFQEAVAVKNRKILEEKAFKNSIKKIIMSRKNYTVLAGLSMPVVIVYGNMDQFIAPHNIPKLLKDNSNIKAIKTEGRHGVSRDKYTKLVGILEEVLNA